MSKLKLLLMIILSTIVMSACGNTNTTKTNIGTTVKEKVHKIKESIFSFGDEEMEKFNAVDITEDGYIIAGYTEAYNFKDVDNNGGEEAFLVKLDCENNEVWKLTYSSDEDDRFYDVKKHDKGYVAVGYSYLDRQNFCGIIAKYDKDGNLVWEHRYGEKGQTSFRSVAVGNDGSIYVSGYTSTSVNGMEIKGKRDALVVKYDTDGNIVWNKNFGGAYNDEFNDIALHNNEIIAVGKVCSLDIEGMIVDGGDTDNVDFDVLLVKYDLDGNNLICKNYGGTLTDEAKSVCVTDNNNIVLVGHTYSTDIEGVSFESGYTGYLIETDINGEVINQANYGNTGWNAFNSVVCNKNDCYIVGYAMDVAEYKSSSSMKPVLLSYINEELNLEKCYSEKENNIADIAISKFNTVIVGDCSSIPGIIEYQGGLNGLIIVE